MRNNRRLNLKKLGGMLLFVAVIGLVVILLIGSDVFTEQPELITYKDFLTYVKEGRVQAIQIQSDVLYGLNADSQFTAEQFFDKGKVDFYCNIPSTETLAADMAVIISETTGKDPSQVTTSDYPFEYRTNQPEGVSLFQMILPYIIIIGAVVLLYYFMMRSQTGGRQISSFAKSRAKATIGNPENVTFANVAGADEEKNELKEVVDFLRNPKRFTKMGARIPKGVLLVGPPGTGKTLLAKAAAGEANVPFFAISGSDFVEMFVGVGASRVRDLFNTAKKCAPSIVFIDEIDAVGRQRGSGMGGGHDEREQTLNQLLVEMDGFSANEGIIVISATNRLDILDPALLRPGRFDRRITVNYPDVRGREEILKVHAKGKPFEDSVDLSVIARSTPGFTGADLENVLNESAILAARFGKEKISMDEIEESISRVIMGPEKKSRVMTQEDKRTTAYHEAGHAIIAMKLPGCDPLHEISIIPRGMAAGYTMTLPERDRTHMTRHKLLDEIAMTLGGRAAETIAMPDISTGAYNDLQRASATARSMVVEYGMSDKIGPIFLGGQSEVFIGRDLGHMRNFSEDLASKVDSEVRSILDEQFERAKEIVSSDMDALNRVADALMEYERMTGEEFEAMYKGEDVNLVSYKEKQDKRERDIAERNKREQEEEEELRRQREAELEAVLKNVSGDKSGEGGAQAGTNRKNKR